MTRRLGLKEAAALVLGVALLSYIVSRALLAEARRWAGTHSFANTPDGAVYLWWSLWLPLSVASAVLAIGCLVAARRWFGQGRRSDAVWLLFVGFLSWLGLWAALLAQESAAGYGAKPEGSRLRPLHAGEVFSRAKWRELEGREWLGEALGQVAAGGVGIPTHPNVIPHDESLLERFTFVGLPPVEVSRLLGSRLREVETWPAGSFGDPRSAYRMCCPDPERRYSYWVLELTFSGYSGVVRKERLYERSPYHRYTPARGADG